MHRRTYLAAVGAATLGAAAGCSTVRQELADRQAGAGFEFPEGVGTDGITAPETVFERHVAALAGTTYSSEFQLQIGVNEGAMYGGGTEEFQRWALDLPQTQFTEFYMEDYLSFAGTAAEADERARLVVGDWGRQFASELGDTVGIPFYEALDIPWRETSLEIQSDRDPPVAVFELENVTERVNHKVSSAEHLELAIDAEGVIRRIDAEYEGGGVDKAYEYTLERGTEPPADRSGHPDAVGEYPQFGTEWQDDGRVLEVTNTGGGPVVGERPYGQLDAMEFDFGDSSAWGERVKWRSLERLAPGETGYLYFDDGPVLAPSPPDDTGSLRAIRGEEPPRFRYQYDEEDDVGPYELLYDTACDGLDC